MTLSHPKLPSCYATTYLWVPMCRPQSSNLIDYFVILATTILSCHHLLVGSYLSTFVILLHWLLYQTSDFHLVMPPLTCGFLCVTLCHLVSSVTLPDSRLVSCHATTHLWVPMSPPLSTSFISSSIQLATTILSCHDLLVGSHATTSVI